MHKLPTGISTTTVHLPLISVTLSRAELPVRRQSWSVGGGFAEPWGAGPATLWGVPLTRLAFYTGAVAVGALEVVEWPVALLVVLGSYVAGRARDLATPLSAPAVPPAGIAVRGPGLPPVPHATGG